MVGGNWCHDNLPGLFGEVLRFPGPSRPPLWVTLGTLAWTLWCTRNKLVIERVILCRVTDVIYKMCGFLQLWRPLSKRCDRGVIDNIMAGLRSAASAFAHRHHPPSRIGLFCCAPSETSSFPLAVTYALFSFSYSRTLLLSDAWCWCFII